MAQNLLLSQRTRLSLDLQSLHDEGYVLSSDNVPPKWLARHYEWLERTVNKKYWFDPQHWLVVVGVPYVTRHEDADGRWHLTKDNGELTMPLSLTTVKPKEHWCVWLGDRPLKANGHAIGRISAPNQTPRPEKLLLMSIKPPEVEGGRYDDFYDKVVTYYSALASEAKRLLD